MSEETMDLTPQLTLTPDAAAAAPQAPSLTLEPNADQQQAQAAQRLAHRVPPGLAGRAGGLVRGRNGGLQLGEAGLQLGQFKLE